jgi:pimeloyl-ACP methyl ester carboxylesterase
MRKIICLQVLFLVTVCSFAQIPDCPYERVRISSTEHMHAMTPVVINEGMPQKSNNDSCRDIFFIHGLGGSSESWEKVAQACWDESLNIFDFPPRKCNTYRLDYGSSTASIGSATYHIGQQIRDRAALNVLSNSIEGTCKVNSDKSIIIAHSQGGIIARTLMHMDFVSSPIDFKGYGGVITVASPLKGAMILNNRPLLHNMAEDACNALAPVVIGGDVMTSIISLFGKSLTKNLCNVAANDLMKVFFSQYYDGVTDSYTVGSQHIDNLDANAHRYSSMPKISFSIDAPQDNILWRTANWIINDPNKTAGYFDANDNLEFYNNTIKPTHQKCSTDYEHYKVELGINSSMAAVTGIVAVVTLGTGTIVAGGMSLIFGGFALNAGLNMRANKKAKEWFDDANESWQTVIGARYYDKQTGIWEIWPNDGVVLEKDMYLRTGIGLTSAVSHISSQSTHMQIRNDRFMKKLLNGLFNGARNPFFKTPTKD